MALIDTYLNNVQRKNEEIARLQQQKAVESKKIATSFGKINSASQAMSRTSNPSTIRSKMNEIARCQNEQSAAEKKVADLETKIAQKHKELVAEQKKVSKEQENIQKKQNIAYQKQSRESEMTMRNIKTAIGKHDRLHTATMSKLEQLSRLPEFIKVLFLASNPFDQQQLRLDVEAREINENISKAKHRDSVKLETRWAVRTSDIFQAINEVDPTIIHFSGHGSEADEIVFQNPDGSAKLVSKEAIAMVIASSSDKIRLVFFNTCFSFRQAEAVSKHVDAAIGMNTSIGDDAAYVFAAQFYSAIGFGFSLKRAFDQAKAQMMLEGIDEENTPELFIKDGLSADEIFLVKPAE